MSSTCSNQLYEWILHIPLATYSNTSSDSKQGAGPSCARDDAINSPATLNSSLANARLFTKGYPFELKRVNLIWCKTSAKHKRKNNYTHVKISQLVASPKTSRQQVVFARLVTSCQQVWNKLLTTCNNLVDIIRLVTRLFQQGCYNHDIKILLQPCVVNLVTFLLYQDRIRLATTTL